MYIHGAFVNQIGDTITVHIVTNNDRTKEVEIGRDDAGLYFTDDPVNIESQVNDTFDHLCVDYNPPPYPQDWDNGYEFRFYERNFLK